MISKEEDIQQSLKKKIPLNEAITIAEELKTYFLNHANKVEIVGSIRRKKEFVNDIDFVVIAKPFFVNSLFNLNIKMRKLGKKLLEFAYKDVQVDVYFANEENFEVIKLIRTGSANHNIKLCSLAKNKGMHLFADGQGLWKGFEKVSDTEEGILKELLGEYIEPEMRE